MVGGGRGKGEGVHFTARKPPDKNSPYFDKQILLMTCDTLKKLFHFCPGSPIKSMWGTLKLNDSVAFTKRISRQVSLGRTQTDMEFHAIFRCL